MTSANPPPHQKSKLFEIELSNLLQPANLHTSLDILTLVDLIVDYGPTCLDLSTRLSIIRSLGANASSSFWDSWSTSTSAARLVTAWLDSAFSGTSSRFHSMQEPLIVFLGTLPFSNQLCQDGKLVGHLEHAASRLDAPRLSSIASTVLGKWKEHVPRVNPRKRWSQPRRVEEASSSTPTLKRKYSFPESFLNSNAPKRRQIPSGQPTLPARNPNTTVQEAPQTAGPDRPLSLEEICENLQPHEIVEYVEAAVRLVRAEQFQWRDGDQHSGMFILLALVLKVISTKPLYQHLLSLQDNEAQSMLNSMQLLLDFPASLDPIDRRSILKALLRLSNKSELYPECLTLHRVERSSQALALDEGSYGEVFRGRFENQNVALKVFKVRERSDVSKILKAVWKEAILWSQVSHDNLLPFYGVYHLGDQHNRVCLVSPWMEPGNIIYYLKHNPTAERILLLSDIVNGISYLHAHEIIHGDLKGANILVSTAGRACLADFGLSKVTDPLLLRWTSVNTATATGGTLRWQAPELFTPEDQGDVVVSTKSDIYSFACVCYEIITGKVPFYQISQPYTVILKVMAGARPSRPTDEENLHITGPLWEMMEECWSQDPNKRPSAEEILRNNVFASLIDRRQEQHWDGFSASQFRRAMTMLAGDP